MFSCPTSNASFLEVNLKKFITALVLMSKIIIVVPSLAFHRSTILKIQSKRCINRRLFKGGFKRQSNAGEGYLQPANDEGNIQHQLVRSA